MKDDKDASAWRDRRGAEEVRLLPRNFDLLIS